MPRRLKVYPTKFAPLDLQVINSYGGEWEPDWRALQGSSVAELFTVITKEVMDHTLARWLKPLVDSLGIPPEGALRKIPRKCADEVGCPFHDKDRCIPFAKKMPWCFIPSGIVGNETRHLAQETVRLWREGVYIVVVEEELHG